MLRRLTHVPFLLVAPMVLCLAGCAGGAASPDPSATPSAAPGSELTVIVDNGKGEKTTWRLTCDPAGGDHPDSSGACSALETQAAKALPPVSPGKACTELYGGPQTATITGTWRGQKVDSDLSRTNGCEIARWEALKAVVDP